MRWALGWALIGAAMTTFGCGADAGSRGLDGGNATGGDKADGVNDAKQDPSHADQVDACDLAAEAASRDSPTPSEELRIQQNRRDCVEEVNDSVVPLIDDALDDADHDGTGFTSRVMADNRDTAADMCREIAAAGDDPVGTRGEVAAASCEAVMERNLADLIARHVELGDEPVAIPGAYRRYRECYTSIDQPSDDHEGSSSEQALQEQIDAFDRLANCIHAADAALTVEMGDRIADAKGGDAVDHGQELFDILQAHRARLNVVCEHFAYAGPGDGPDPVEVGQHRCLISGLEARGRLIEEITDLVPPFEGGSTPDPDPDPDSDRPIPSGEDGEVCFPGANNDWTACFRTLPASEMPSGYQYSSGFGGNPNYRPPVAFLDPEEIGLDTKLAPNFTISEFMQQNSAGKCGSFRYVVIQPHAVASMQQLRDQIGSITINSGYRAPFYNECVGGATFSRHMYGDGFDFNPNEVGLSTGESACTQLGGKLVEYSSHVHCDFRFDPADSTLFGPTPNSAIVDRPPFEASLQMRDGQWEAPAEGFEEGEPKRRWIARDAEGFVIGRHTGSTYAPPPDTATVQVTVGGVVEVEMPLTGREAPGY